MDQYYLILDGINELESLETTSLIDHLLKLQQYFINLRLCLSHRIGPDDSIKSISSRFRNNAVLTHIPEVNPDIESFIESELERRIDSGKLALRDPSIVLKIAEALTRGSQGMFLWVYLQIETLCAMKTDAAIRQALLDLPRDLSQIYSRMLHRYGEEHGTTYQKELLEFTISAFRPLTTEELREALAVVPGDATWMPERLATDIHATLACCGPLMTGDEEESTVRLIHQSVKQFLTNGELKLRGATVTMEGASQAIELHGATITIEGANRTMLRTIATYLNYGVFETQLSASVIPQTICESALSKILDSTMPSSSNARKMAVKLLRSRKASDYDLGRIHVEAQKFKTQTFVNQFHFYDYCKLRCLDHCHGGLSLDGVSSPFVAKLIRDEKLFGDPERPFKDTVRMLLHHADNVLNEDQAHEFRDEALSRASRDGCYYVVRCLLESGKVDPML